MIESILQSGIQGIQGGLDQFGRAAHNIANANNHSSGLNNKNIVDDLIDVKEAQMTIQSSAAVIKVADESLGTILDVIA